MKNDGITLKEFVAVMVAATMIMCVLVPTNHPRSTKGSSMVASPRFAVQFTTDPNGDYKTYPSPWTTPSNGGWGCSWSGFWGGAWHALSGMFFGHPVTDY